MCRKPANASTRKFEIRIRLKMQGDHMRQFAVIGLGRFGRKVAKTLAKKGVPVIAIDSDPDLVSK